MSGGHFNFSFYQLEELANDIEQEFINDGKYLADDWDSEISFLKRPQKEYDRLEDATEEERVLILAEIKSLAMDLRNCFNRARKLDYYLSGDTGATSYLERLKDTESWN